MAIEKIRRMVDWGGDSCFLIGPRGAGKTEWVRERHPEALRIDLEDAATHRELAARPEGLAEWVGRLVAGRTVVIEDVQRLPELLGVAEGLIGKEPGRTFVLTASNERVPRRRVPALWRRFEETGRVRRVHPFLAADLGGSFDLATALRRGLVPGVLASEDPDAALLDNWGAFLREDLQGAGLVRKIGDFVRFLEAMVFVHGEVLNLSEVARECGAKRKTVEGFVGLLEDFLLGFRVTVFGEDGGQRALARHPKFYFSDAGAFRSLRGEMEDGGESMPAEAEAAALEGLVAQHLRSWCDAAGGGRRLHCWRTRTGIEVDFVVESPDGLHAFDVRNRLVLRPKDFRALAAFGTDYPESRRILLHRGTERSEKDGVLCLPVAEFLKELRPDLPLPGGNEESGEPAKPKEHGVRNLLRLGQALLRGR
jgi:predicted AAA+ superfamily ATPase